MKVIGFGDNIIDRFPSRGIEYPGGNCLNFSVFASMLGAQSAYLGVFGDDDRAARLADLLATFEVATDFSEKRTGPTGWTTIEVVGGDRVFVGSNNRGGVTRSSPLELTDRSIAYIDGFDLVHSSVYSAAESQLPRLAGRRPLLSYDFSSNAEFHSPEYLERVCPSLDLALFSCSHLDIPETEELLHQARTLGADMALATRGSHGSILSVGDHIMHQPSLPIEDQSMIQDTTGCGDAFLAAFVISALANGWNRSTFMDAEQFRSSLREASLFARDQCFVEGAFGHGWRLGATEL